MRIISGKYKGRKIKAPIIEKIKPTTDFAKTGLFNVLNNYTNFEGLVVLDLFSGFGNIAFEFASRGAQYVDAVDIHPQSIKFIKQFAQNLNLPINTYRIDALEFIRTVYQKYDIIFADPPYNSSFLLDDILDIIKKRNLLKPNGIVVLEHQKGKLFNSPLQLFNERKYGKVHFSFFRNNK